MSRRNEGLYQELHAHCSENEVLSQVRFCDSGSSVLASAMILLLKLP